MLKITLNNLVPFDGAYDLDFNDPFTKRELHWIKQIAGVRVGELMEASEKGDSDLLVAFAVIATARAGKLRKEQVNQFVEMLLDAPDSSLDVEDIPDLVEDDADPLAQETPPPSQSGEPESNGSSTPGSSEGGDDPQVTGQAFTGLRL